MDSQPQKGGASVTSWRCPSRAVFSSLYLVGYLAMATLALVLGAVATAWGLGVAIELGVTAITIVSLVTLVLTGTAPPNAPK